MSLQEYDRKRRFGQTPEPRDRSATQLGKSPIFVVQLHHASHRHYDFRLEVDGALKSWAIPKGPSLRPGEKRLAVEVEDHPLSYAQFEGEIPTGNYGAGHVEIFDRGTWSSEADPLESIAAGKLDFSLQGKKLNGAWKLVRTGLKGRQPQWLLFKRDDAFAAQMEADDLVGKAKPVRASRGASPARKRVNAKRSGWAAHAASITGAVPSHLPASISPQLASARKSAPVGDDWLHEIKWDGYRLTASVRQGKATLRTRNGLDWTDRFPEIAEAVAALPVSDAHLDGEVVALDGRGVSDFSGLQRALKSGHTAGLSYIVFDLPGIDGIDLSAASLLERKGLLEKLLAKQSSSLLAYSRHIVGHGDQVFEASRGQGVEGIISKAITAPYEQARSTTWVKVKHAHGDDFVVVGYTLPKGSRSELGALLLAKRSGAGLSYVGRVGTGFDDKTLRELARRLAPLKQDEPVVELPAHVTIRAADVQWVRPQLVAEIAFRGWGKEGLLRQAAFKRLRDDKQVADLTPDQTAHQSLTHPERVVYPSAGITKGEVAAYYRAVSSWLLRDAARRPLSIVRCPDGAEGNCFFQKHPLRSPGSAVKSVRLELRSGQEDYLQIDDQQGLLALVQANTLEFHAWGSRSDAPDQPDRLVFDLDPGPGITWKQVVAAARDVRARLEETGLQSFVRCTGGKGLHVVAPIERGPGWESVKQFCQAFALAMAAHRPTHYVATMSKAKRANRIFIDWLRNGRGATSVASWSLRARAGAPVAMPLRWEELGRIKAGNAFDLGRATRRAAKLRADPWERMYELRQPLPGS